MRKVNLNSLTRDQIKILINDLKHPSKEFDINEIRRQIQLTNISKLKRSTLIIGTIDNIDYVLHIYLVQRAGNKRKCSIHLRFKNTNEHLIRIDIGSGHLNPKGFPDCKHIDHIHIYNPNFEPHDSIAYPLSDYQFPNIITILKAFDSFLIYTNIKKLGDETDECWQNWKRLFKVA